MGSVKQISESLSKLGEDKKSLITTRYQEHSMWLSNQFDLIRGLILTNPRDQLAISDASVVGADSKNLGVIGQKRKSSEHMKRTGESPGPKRTSSELMAILEENGLPADLQKMRKDQLVFELESRGLTEYSMKNLKNDLVDALKTALLSTRSDATDESERVEEGEVAPASSIASEEAVDRAPEASIAQEAVPEEERSAAVAESVSVPVPPRLASVGGRSSLMLSSLRAQLRESVAAEAVQAPAGKSEEAEFEARLRRHRESQAAKLPETLPSTPFKDAPAVVASAHLDVSDKLSVERIVLTEAAAQDTKEPPADECIAAETLIVEEAVKGTAALAIADPVVAIVTAPSKPSNLVSGQTSFVGGEKQKPMVAALLKAEKLREVEEMKLQEKRKKEAERKVALQQSSLKWNKPQPVKPALVYAPKPPFGLSSAPPAKAPVAGQVSAPVTAAPTPKPEVPKSAPAAPKEVAKETPTTPSTMAKIFSIFSIKKNLPVPDNGTPLTESKHEPLKPISAGGLQPRAEVKIVSELVDKPEIPEANSESGDDSDTDDEDDKKADVPDWAKGPALRAALEKQYGLDGSVPVDPDTIFHEVLTCSLEEIFGASEGRSGKYNRRTSSARWDKDELTTTEKKAYKMQMGYATNF